MPKAIREINRICVFGVGGVGGYFGGKIAHRLAELHDEREIGFVARGRHLGEIQRSGLTLKLSDEEQLQCRPTHTVRHLDELPPADLILLCVKAYDLDEAIDEIAGHSTSDTKIIPLLNGVDIYRRVRARLKTGVVFPACVYVGTHIEKPGVVASRGGDGKILFGTDPERPDVTPISVFDLFDRFEIAYQWADNPYPAIWEKYLFIAAFGLVTAAFNKTLGEVIADRELSDMAREIMAEIALLATKEGVALRGTIIPETLEKAHTFPFETKTSFQRDIERGGRNEGDLFGGTILRLGREHDISTPVTEVLYARIQDGHRA